MKNEVQHIISVAEAIGIDFDLIDATEAKARNPLLDINGVIGALRDDKDGDIDPAQLSQALAARSRKAGAIIHRNTHVTALKQLPNNEWQVTAEQGTITAEHIVIAAGYRVNKVGALMGIEYPVIAMEHMYFITEYIPELNERSDRVPMIRCPRDTLYMRQEKKGLLIGIISTIVKPSAWMELIQISSTRCVPMIWTDCYLKWSRFLIDCHAYKKLALNQS